MNASAISAALRRGGFNPLGSGASRTREGLRVSGSLSGIRSLAKVRVCADLDSAGAARRMAQAALETLRELGYETTDLDSGAFYVTGRAER